MLHPECYKVIPSVIINVACVFACPPYHLPSNEVPPSPSLKSLATPLISEKCELGLTLVLVGQFVIHPILVLWFSFNINKDILKRTTKNFYLLIKSVILIKIASDICFFKNVFV